MTCPYCNSDNTTVKESRQLKGLRRRRYVCMSCNNRFTTHEIAVHHVGKKNMPTVYVSDDSCWVSANLVTNVKPVEKPG